MWPASGAADTRSQTYGIWSNKRGCVDRLVRRVASKRVGEQKSAAERVEPRPCRRTACPAARCRSGRATRPRNADYLDKFRRPLIRLGYLPRELSFHTTADELRLVALQDGMTHLAAPQAPPELPPGAALVVRLHESLVNNLAEDVLADRTSIRPGSSKWPSVSSAACPTTGADEERGPWSITFAPREPITLHIEANRATLVLRGRKVHDRRPRR